MIYIDNNAKTPIYQQLYEQLKEQITNGTLSCEKRLPSTRRMAETLLISRNTVDNAYAQLCLEGYIESRPGAGYYVVDINRDFLEPRDNGSEKTLPAASAEAAPQVPLFYDFQYGNLPAESFPETLWLHYTKEVLLSYEARMVNSYGDQQGEMALRKELVKYLKTARGVRCEPEQVIICTGLQRSLDIVGSLFNGRNNVFAIEDPGYDVARAVFYRQGFKIAPIPVNRDGIDTASLKKARAKVVYITPSHQFPMGFIMPISNRLQILDWAEQNDAYIIEDDYDCELRYHQRPIPSLQGISDGNRCIYTGTFSKLFSPGFRMSYLILPPQLLTTYRRIFAGYYCEAPWLQQMVVAHYMIDGHYDKHLRRAVNENGKKHDIMVHNLQNILGGKADILGVNAGTHIIVQFTDGTTATERIRQAAKVGVKVYPTKHYWYDKSKYKDDTLLLGYTKLSEKEIKEGLVLLAEAWDDK